MPLANTPPYAFTLHSHPAADPPSPSPYPQKVLFPTRRWHEVLAEGTDLFAGEDMPCALCCALPPLGGPLC